VEESLYAAAPPVISGSYGQGQAITTTNGLFSGPTGATYSYQWQDCSSSGEGCSDVESEGTSASYVAQSSDVGHTLRAIVTATNNGGSWAQASAATPVIVAPPSSSTPLPVLSGSTAVGSTLTTTTGSYAGGAVKSYSYQWQACNASGAECQAIPAATSTSYTITHANAGSTLRAAVTAHNAAATGTTEDSAPTATIAAATVDALAWSQPALVADEAPYAATKYAWDEISCPSASFCLVADRDS
jgi:hypothetical protein